MITSINHDQAARFDEWVDKWTKIGLSTAPADFNKAQKAALTAYEICNWKRPQVVLRVKDTYCS